MSRLLRFVPAGVWAALIFFLSSRHALPSFIGDTPGLDKVGHTGLYAILAALLLYGAQFPRLPASLVWVAVASAYGVTDEYHQSFVVGRSSDAMDWVADTCGATLSAVAMHFWRPSWR